MSSKNVHSSFFSTERNEVAPPSAPLLSRISSLSSTIAKNFFNFFNSFLSGIQEEKRRGYQFITTIPHLEVIRNIFYYFTKPNSLVEEKEETKGIKLLADLIRRVEKKTPTVSPPSYEKRDSLLRKVGVHPSHLNLSTFSSLFGLNHSLSTSSFKDLVDYVGNYFILQKSEEFSPFFFPALQQAIAEKGEVEKLILAKDQKALERKAEEIASSMESIQEGKPFIYVGNISKGAHFSTFILDAMIKVLPEEFKSLLTSQNSPSTDLIRETLQKKISELFQNTEAASDFLKVKEQLSKKIENTWGSVSSGIEFVLPKSWAEAVQNSIKEDCHELLFGLDSPDGAENFAKQLWNRMNTNELEATLKTALADLCNKGGEILQEGVKEITCAITRSLPLEAMDFFEDFGFNNQEATISIEIERQNNGKLRLILFSKPTSHHCEHSNGVQLPLVYSDLDPEVLGKEFFFRLLSYQAFPKWDGGISYSLDDFFEGLIATLGKEPSEVEKHTLIPFSSYQMITNWSLTELILRYHLKLDGNELQKTLYDLRIQAFLDIWNEAEVKQNPNLKNTLQSALDSLVSDSLKLFNENLLSLDHLKAMHATVQEWEEITKQPATRLHTISKTTLPPILQEGLREVLSSCEIMNQHIDLVKEAFSDLFGKEIEESLQYAIDEIIPTLSNKKAPIPVEKTVSWTEFFRGEIKAISSMRISLLSFYKLYARYSHMMSKGLEFYVSGKLLHSLLENYLPSLAVNQKATAVCASLLCYFGPGALQTIFPENAYQLISSIYAFYYEAIGYLKQRINLFVIRQSIYYLLGSDQITHINHLVKETQQKVTRDGEISYEIRGRQEKTIQYHFIDNSNPLENTKKGVTPPKEDPTPEPVVLTKSNLIPTLNSWVQKVEGNHSNSATYYLNSQIRNFPIPRPGHPSIWDEVEDIPSTLESLHSLFLALHNRKEFSLNSSEHVETMISLFVIYCIIDYLTRRSPESHLTDEWKPNGCGLMVFVNNPFFKVKNPRTYTQLESLGGYFDFDITKRYTSREIMNKRADCLFNYLGLSNGNIITRAKDDLFGKTDPMFLIGTRGSEIELAYATGSYFKSQDAKYYQKLLSDPSIQKKLDAHLGKGAGDWEKYFCLFTDPPMQNEHSSKGIREGILPRSFYLLRFMHTLLSSKNGDELYTPAETTSELSLKPKKVEWKVTGWPTLERALNIGTKVLHTATFNMYRRLTLESNILGFDPFYSENYRRHLRTSALTTGADLSDFPPYSPNVKIEVADYIHRLFLKPGSRKQDEIMHKILLHNPQIGKPEKKILEMVTSHKSDQVIRSIGYFTHNLERLSDPTFRLIFDLFIHNIGALQSQLSDHPEIATILGSFFEKGLDHFYQNQDYLTCLYLSTVGGDVLQISQRFKKDATSCFPNFRSFIREKIIPNLLNAPPEKRFITLDKLRTDLILLSLDYLAASYEDVDPSEIEQTVYEEALVDIARSSFFRLPPHIGERVGKKANWAWSPLIRKAIESRPIIRRKILEAILKDGGIPLPQNYDGTWIGSFPLYQSGGLKVDLLANNDTVAHRRELVVQHVATNILGEKGLNRSIVATQRLGDPVILSDTVFSYPEHQIVVEILDITKNLFMTTKTFGQNEIKCRLVSCKEESDQQIWIEENPKSEKFLVVFTQKNKITSAHNAKYITEAHEGIELLSKYPIHGETENKIDLAKNDHGLALLTWFQPLEKIAAFSTIQNPERISRIEFPRIKNGSDNSEKLIFTIENNKALSDGTFPGFSIASRQKEPKLASYSDYLLLENEKEEKKVLLVAHPIQTHLLSFFAKHLGELSTSPFIESLLSSFLGKEKQEESSYYVYTLNKEGKLETSDPVALAYLFVHHFMHGNNEELLSALCQLEIFGKLYPFSDSTLSILHSLHLPLLTLQTDFMNEVSLRLSSIQAENELFHPQKKEKKDPSPLDLLDYFFIQSKYVTYLNGLKEGKPPYLTEYQELFILNKLEQQNHEFLQQKINDTGIYQKLVESIGLDSLTSRLFLMPVVAKRSFYLRAKHQEESHWKIRGENLLYQGASELLGLRTCIESKGSTTPQKEENQGKSNLVKVARSISKYASRPFQKCTSLLPADDRTKQFLIKLSSTQKLEDLPLELWEITPRIIEENFPLYYRLATKSIPLEWKGNPEKEALFAQQVATFQKILPLLKGTYSTLSGLFIPILQTISKSSPFYFLTADQLEEYIKQAREYTICSDEINHLRFGSISSHSVLNERKEELKNKVATLSKERDPIEFFCTLFEKEVFEKCKTIDRGNRLFNKQTAQLTLSTGFSALKWYAPYLLFSTIGMEPLFYVYRTAQFGLGLLRRVVNMDDVETSLSVQEEQRPKEDLPIHLSKAMIQKEGQINFVIDNLFAKYFVEEKETGDDLEPSAEIPPLETIEKEEAIVEAFSKLNQSVQDYYTRPPVMNKGCRLKEGKDPLKLKKKIDSIQKAIHSFLKEEEKEIVSLVNPRVDVEGMTESERMQYKLKGLINKEVPLAFDKVCTLFSMGKEEELLKRKGVVQETLEIIKEKFYVRLLLLSRFNLLAKTAREKGALEIGKELQRRRVYTFTDSPEKLIRGKLLFEANQQVLLWDKPNKQLDAMLFSPHKQSVLELIMASGKSFFIIPEVSHYEADGNQLICNIWPTPVARNAINFIGSQAKKVYNQTANALQCNRSIDWTLNSLWGIYQVFKRTLFEKEQMNTTKEDMQAFELRFIEEGLDVTRKFQTNPDWKGKLSYYMKTLGLVRKSGKANIDEPHIQFEPTKELNHPLGKEVRLKESYIDLMKEILILLVTIPEIRDIVGIKNKKPSPLDPKIFKEKVLPILAFHVAEIDSLNIPKKDRKQLVSYLMGNEKIIPPFVLNSKERSLIGLAKGMLTVLLSRSLERIIHVDFATSKKGNGNYARPSEGNENPSETSDIRNPYEAFIKTGILKLHEGLSADETRQFLAMLVSKGEKEEKKTHIPFRNTIYARFFKKLCPDYDLLNISTLPDKDMAVILETFQKSDIATMTYTAWEIGPQIKYFLLNLKSDSYNFGSMFPSFYSYDGSPNKEGCFPHNTHVHRDNGTTGESIDFLVKNCSKESSICILKKEAPYEVLEELLNFFQKNPNMRVIIDRGAILNGISNEKVAKVLQHYIETNRKDLDGVSFYNLDKELMILEKEAKKPIRLEESRILKEKRITYFDQCHTYAADVPQQENAEGVISVGEDLTLEQLAQAIWRMRGLKNANQKLTFVMTEKVRKLISGEKKPTIEDIIKFAARNEAHLLAEYNYSADRQKLQNIIRRAILDKIIFAENVDQALAIMQEFKDVLMTKIEDDPFILYGYVDTFEKPTTLIDELRTTLSAIIENSSTFTIAEKANINHELNQIGHATYPEKIHAYKLGDQVFGNKLDDLGKTTQIETDGSSELEMDVHVEVEQNLQQQVQNPQSREGSPSFWPWSKNLIPSDLTWLKVTEIPGTEGILGGVSYYLSGLKRFIDQVPIFSLKEALQSAVDPAIREIAGAIDPSILATNNFIQLIDRGMRGRYVDPYSKHQKPTFEALIIQEEKNGKKERTILLFDQEEAEFWRDKLREEKKEETITNPHVKLGLYDLVSQTLVISGKNPLTNNELKQLLFERIQLQLNFLGARVNYNKDEQKILLPWIQKNDPDKMKAAFLNIHEHHGTTPFIGSDLEELFYLAKRVPQEQRIRV